MTPGFVAAVLEGFEATLDAVLERLDDGDLKRDFRSISAASDNSSKLRESRSRSHPPREGFRASSCAGLWSSGPRLAHTSNPRRPVVPDLLRFRRSRQT
jgi:hypothetical protein